MMNIPISEAFLFTEPIWKILKQNDWFNFNFKQNDSFD